MKIILVEGGNWKATLLPMVTGISGMLGWKTDCFRALVVVALLLVFTSGVLLPQPMAET